VFEVSNVLGCGFLERVYRQALLNELRLRGLSAECEVRRPVVYKGQLVGEYIADIVVESRVIVELKCVDAIVKEHYAQCINYLKATGHRVALLVNFKKPKVEWKRIVYDA
jgi:GxxExxY protein